MAAAVLCYINLLNYMNWFIIAGEEGARHPAHLPAGCPAATVAFVQQALFLRGIIFLLSSPLAMPT